MAAFLSPALPASRARPALLSRAAPRACAPIPPLNGDEAHAMKEIYAVKPGSKTPVCRCWQSNKFPLCDGSHNAFNKETGSHVGPLVISSPKPE